MYSTLSSPLLNPLLFNFPLRYSAKPYPRITTTTAPFTGNSIFLFKSFSPLHPLRAPAVAVRSSVNDDKVNEIRPVILSDNPKRCGEENNALAIAKPVAYALLCIVFGFCFPFFGFRRPALAASAAAPPAAASRLVVTEENGHEYSSCTRRLLTVVSKLLKIIEAAKIEGKVDCGPNVEEGLQEVKTTKGALQEEIMNGLYAELRVLNGEKETLMNRSEEIVDKVFKSKREEENLAKKVKGGVAKGGKEEFGE
ncbi:hypothetical protein ABFS82_12G051100 [Erythranthe guttata]